MLDWLAALPPVTFWLVVALLFVGLVALLFTLLAGRGQDVEPGERPQDVGDLVRLVATL